MPHTTSRSIALSLLLDRRFSRDGSFVASAWADLTRSAPPSRERTLAGAVAAAVLGACAARFHHPLLERFARAKHAHPGITRGQAPLGREGLHRLPADVDQIGRAHV